jgi:hypothetical protein
MISKRIIALRDAYPLGLENSPEWRIKKGRSRTAVIGQNRPNSVYIQTKWGGLHYNIKDFRELTNIEKLTGRSL